MKRQEAETRLQGREAQTRGWAQPMPQMPTFSLDNGVRQRLEWETRDTINNRLWADTMEAGAKAVTTAMLAAHPSKGAETMNPTASRSDNRPYLHEGVPYFPDAPVPAEGMAQDRPRLPPKTLFQNPWLNNYDIESGDIARELRGVVKESNKFLTQDAGARMAARTFEHQWIPAAATLAIVERKIEASELLRPAHDDYTRDYRSKT